MFAPRRRTIPVRAASLLLALAAARAQAQWSVIELSPPDAQLSRINAIFGGTEAGVVDGHAAVWHGTLESLIDFNPPWSSSSTITALSADQQFGSVTVSGFHYYGYWTGTPESWRPLVGGDGAVAGGAAGTQIGSMGLHAFLWSGTTESGVDLQPLGASFSYAYATDGTHQFGMAHFPVDPTVWYDRAGYWTGTPDSWVSMHPDLFRASTALAVSGGQVAGVVQTGVSSGYRAALWNDLSTTVVDLTPPRAYWAKAYAVHDGWQAGFAGIDRFRASVWHGTMESWEDLSPALPLPRWQWLDNEANGIWADGVRLTAVGYANSVDGHGSNFMQHAMLWTRPVCYANCDYSTSSPALDIDDFICFQSKFAAGDLYANCDGSTTAPQLNIADYICFMSKFAAGCE